MSSVAEIIAELDDHGFEDTGSTRKAGVVSDTIEDVCSREAWPFLEKTLQLTFDGISSKPSNFPSDFSKVQVLTDPTQGVVIPWERIDTIRRRYPMNLNDVGNPQYFYFVGNELRLWPVPPAGSVLDLVYLAWHPKVDASTLEAGILIPVRHHRVIVLGALTKLYSMEDDPELAQVFDAQYEKRIASMREDLLKEQYDRPDQIFVVDEYDFD